MHNQHAGPPRWRASLPWMAFHFYMCALYTPTNVSPVPACCACAALLLSVPELLPRLLRLLGTRNIPLSPLQFTMTRPSMHDLVPLLIHLSLGALDSWGQSRALPCGGRC